MARVMGTCAASSALLARRAACASSVAGVATVPVIFVDARNYECQLLLR